MSLAKTPSVDYVKMKDEFSVSVLVEKDETTDPRLLDVTGAMELLPDLPLEDIPNREECRAIGTFDTHTREADHGLGTNASMLAP